MGLFSKLFGSYSDRELKRIMPIAKAVEDREAQYAALTDEQLRGKTDELKQRLANGETLDDILLLPAYLNALAGEGVHIVTVNDYLARRDSEWMGKVHRFLGLSVGLIVHGLTNEERREAYACDITYGTNNEMGFDYLRDNMALMRAPISTVRRTILWRG